MLHNEYIESKIGGFFWHNKVILAFGLSSTGSDALQNLKN